MGSLRRCGCSNTWPKVRPARLRMSYGRFFTMNAWRGPARRSQKDSDGEPLGKIGGRALDTDVEGTKERIDRADLIKTHFVDELFEYQRIIGKEVHSPLPIVESDRTRNDLLHLAGITASDHSVVMHLAFALG